MKSLISKCSMIPAWHQLVPISGHVEESETARKWQLYATSIKTSVSTRLFLKFLSLLRINFSPKSSTIFVQLISKSLNSCPIKFQVLWLWDENNKFSLVIFVSVMTRISLSFHWFVLPGNSIYSKFNSFTLIVAVLLLAGARQDINLNWTNHNVRASTRLVARERNE